MEIITIPISEIHAAAYNPRKDLHPGDETYEKLKRSIERFGYAAPIIWNRRTKNIVGGHQCFKILKAEGAQEITVSVVDLSSVEEKALNVALNKIDGQWDEDKLQALLKEISDSDIDELLTGFNADELEGLLADIDEDSFADFFTDDDSSVKEKRSKMTTCPYCGKQYKI